MRQRPVVHGHQCGPAIAHPLGKGGIRQALEGFCIHRAKTAQLVELARRQLDARLPGAPMPASITHEVRRELGWLAAIADQRKPFASVNSLQNKQL